MTVTTLRRLKNYYNSITHRLPPETLVTVASHLVDDESLTVATQVCHFWRSLFLSSPSLWTHLTFGHQNERRALLFLERSKSAPVFVDFKGNSGSREVVEKALKGIGHKLASLQAVDVPFLNELLDQPLPILKKLDIATSGGLLSVGSPTATNPGDPQFRVPNLTHLCFKLESDHSSSVVAPRIGDGLLGLLRNCPLLEVAFFRYGESNPDIAFTTDEESTEAVPLHHLRSFTHESPVETIHLGLFNRLSLRTTCDVSFKTTYSFLLNSWDVAFPPPRNPSYFSDVKKVKIAIHDEGKGSTVVRATFLNARNTRVSLNRSAKSPPYNNTLWIIEIFLRDLSKMAGSVEILHFEHCPLISPTPHYSLWQLTEPLKKLGELKTIVLTGRDNTEFFLIDPPRPSEWLPGVNNLVICVEPQTDPGERIEQDVLERVYNIAMERRGSNPLETVTLFLQNLESGRIEELKSYVGSVKAHSLEEWVEGGFE